VEYTYNGSTPVLSLGRPFAAFVLASICADKKTDLAMDLQLKPLADSDFAK
jgi:hypothetical protein